MTTISFSHLPDDAILAEAHRVVAHERQAIAQVIALLMELDARRLYLGEGYSSLFAYCTEALHLSEHATYGRIEAARAARRFPVILDLLADGSITLTTVTLVASELTPENHREVLERARHKSKRDILLLDSDGQSERPARSLERLAFRAFLSRFRSYEVASSSGCDRRECDRSVRVYSFLRVPGLASFSTRNLTTLS